jgi:hypothetical protein
MEPPRGEGGDRGAAAPIGRVLAQGGMARRVAAVLPLAQEGTRNGQLQLLDEAGAPVGAPSSVVLRGAGGHLRLRGRLERHLPPGRYTAELKVGEETHLLSVEVEPVLGLRPDPPVLVLRGAPGATARAEVTLVNRGNVAAEIPDHGVLGVFRRNGLETAIAHAYRSEEQDGLRVLARFVEGLREEHGGLVKLRIEEGTGPLAPGAAARIRLSAALPEGLRPGQVYAGTWKLANLSYAVRIETTGTGAAAIPSKA